MEGFLDTVFGLEGLLEGATAVEDEDLGLAEVDLGDFVAEVEAVVDALEGYAEVPQV